jgi:putative transcriptional regulator
MHSLLQVLRTVSHLKPRQIAYQLIRRLDPRTKVSQVTGSIALRQGVTWNIAARYQDYQDQFFKMCTAEYSKKKLFILEAVHETAADFYKHGLIDKHKMKKFDALCLEPLPDYDPQKIRFIRESNNISQATLAVLLNISLSTVRKWESGEIHPSGPSLKLLHLIDRKGLEAGSPHFCIEGFGCMDFYPAESSTLDNTTTARCPSLFSMIWISPLRPFIWKPAPAVTRCRRQRSWWRLKRSAKRNSPIW